MECGHLRHGIGVARKLEIEFGRFKKRRRGKCGFERAEAFVVVDRLDARERKLERLDRNPVREPTSFERQGGERSERIWCVDDD